MAKTKEILAVKLKDMTKPEMVSFALKTYKTKIRRSLPRDEIIKMIKQLDKELPKTKSSTEEVVEEIDPNEEKEMPEEESNETTFEELEEEEKPKKSKSRRSSSTNDEVDDDYPVEVTNEIIRPVKGGLMLGGLPEQGKSLIRTTGITHASDEVQT